MGPLLIVDKGRSNGSHRIGTHQKGQFGKSRKIATGALIRKFAENRGKSRKSRPAPKRFRAVRFGFLWLSRKPVSLSIPIPFDLPAPSFV